MLILQRKAGQTIVVGDSITIQVVEINRRSVRLGLTAPAEVRIRRGELSEYTVTRRPPTRRDLAYNPTLFVTEDRNR